MIRDQLHMWIGIELWHLPEWYSRSQIAKAIGATKSPSLLRALEFYVANGTLQSARFVDEHNRPVIKYRITDDYREMQFEGAKKNV